MGLTSASFPRPLGTTFKGKYGCVDYWVKAFLERPSFPTQQVKKRFEVMDPVDVNTPDLLVSGGRGRGVPAGEEPCAGSLRPLPLRPP